MTTEATPAPKVEAWETENAVIVVWGTHDPGIAADTANAWYRANIGDPLEDETLMTPEDFSAETLRFWGRPDAPEHEVWTPDMHSAKPVEGFVPYLAADRY